MSLAAEARLALARTTLLIRGDFYPDASEESIVEELVGLRVRMAPSAATLASGSGQTAVATAAILVAQLGAGLVLDFPEVRLLGPEPPLRGEGLRESLLEHTRDLITPARTAGEADFEIRLGDVPARGPGVWLSADDWSFVLTLEPGAGFAGSLPFGGAFAGAAAAAEVFRFAMVRLGARLGIEPLPEHPLGACRPVSFALPPIALEALDLGRVDSISAGALATSSLYPLLRIPEIAMDLRLIDKDTGARSNLNRYVLLRGDMLRIPKVEALTRYATECIRIEPLPLRFAEETLGGVLPLAPRVLVGVDHIPSRWLAQAHAPDWVGVAATSHFEVVVSEHTPEAPCASCLHPRDADDDGGEIPTVSFVSAFAGFLLAYRLLRAAASGPDPSQTLAYPFSLAGDNPVWRMELSAHPGCKVGCAASASLRS